MPCRKFVQPGASQKLKWPGPAAGSCSSPGAGRRRDERCRLRDEGWGCGAVSHLKAAAAAAERTMTEVKVAVLGGSGAGKSGKGRESRGRNGPALLEGAR